MTDGPVVGGGGRLPRRSLIRRGAVALALALLLIAGKLGVSHGVIKVRTLLPPSHAVTDGLLIGATPSDGDLRQLASEFKVDGVINLGAPNVAEQVTAASLHLSYLNLPMAPQTSPTWPDLRELASFMRTHTAGGAAVFIHDNVGGGRAVVTAAMLLLLRGQAWPAVSAELTKDELGSLCDCQRRAIDRLVLALHPGGSTHRSLAHDPYAAARLDPW
jgi:hypothetical protein